MRANSRALRELDSVAVAAAAAFDTVVIYRPALFVVQRTVSSNERPAISRSCARGAESRKRSGRVSPARRRTDGWKPARLPLYSLRPRDTRAT